MKPINHLFPILGLVALILSACQPLLPPAVQNAPAAPAVEQSMPASPAQPQGLRADAPPYAVHGPYAVGVGNFKIEATTETERPLTVTVWYPALNPQGVPESLTYEMGFPAGETPNVSVLGHAIESATPAIDGAPYPLIVHTHGHWSFRQEAAYLDEHLASMGFVVISADHEDNWSTLFGPKAWQSEFRRPNEVTREIDYAEKLGAVGGPLAGIVDTGHVGVIGWSYGGETALVAAGARLDLGKLRTWCEENKVDGEFPDTDCVDILDHEAELAALAGLNETPQGLWPDWSDERVDAVIGLAPWVGLLSEASLQTLNVPTLLMIGSADTAAGPTYRPFQPYQKIAAERKAEVIFENAEHLLFFSACQDVPEVVGLGLEVFCSDPVWDMDRAHDLINHFATAFLLAELKGDADAATALAAENVSFPGITYETTGYGTVNEAAPQSGLDDATIAKIDALVEGTMTNGQVPGAAVGVVKDGKLVYSKGFGVTALGSDEPVTPDTVFHMGSVAKTPTAVAIMQLVAEGKVDLDAPLTKYLPYFTLADPDLSEVTIRRLLSHTAGMPDPIDWLAEYQDENLPNDEAALDNYVRSLGDQSLTYQPGEDWSYSNTGFDILGDVVATVSGQSFEDYLQANVLTPLGMANSSYLLRDVDPTKLAVPHMYDEDGNTKTLDFYPYTRAHAPSGAFYCNVNDLARFAIANMNQGELDGVRVLPASAYDKMWAPEAASPWAENFGPQVTSYGLGWWVGEFKGHRIIGNYGTEFGFQSHLGLFPDEGLAVIALVNLFDPETGSFYAYDIGNGIAEVLLGTEPTEAAAEGTALDPAMVAEIETLVTETMARINLPGFALAVVKDGNLAYAKGFGVTSLDGGEPVTPQTVFQWAESSMALTAMAVMQLVEEGKLALDAPVTDYVSYFKLTDERYKEITVGQLLAHTSGILDSGDAMADWENFMPEYDGGALERWIRGDLAQKGLLFAPGTGWEYSDIAYALLGAVIGAASGQPYEEYMQEHIFTPLGMDKSTFLLEEVDKTLLASPHVPDAAGEMVVTEAIPYHRPFAATNNLFGNVEEMAKLAQANLNRGVLADQRILPESAYDAMWTATSPTPFADFPFGRIHPSAMMAAWGNGWFLGDVAGHLTPNSYGGEHANLAVVAIGNSQAMDEFYAPDIATDVMGMLLERIEP
jgi:CubicO group peptidase (beta-lactamase class C family)/predicted dienelactone hydrolase